jgi:hypothetical protein
MSVSRLHHSRPDDVNENTELKVLGERLTTLGEYYQICEQCNEHNSKAENRFLILKKNLHLYKDDKEEFIKDRHNIEDAIAKGDSKMYDIRDIGYPPCRPREVRPYQVTAYYIMREYNEQKEKHSQMRKTKGYEDERFKCFKKMGEITALLKDRSRKLFDIWVSKLFPESQLSVTSSSTTESQLSVTSSSTTKPRGSQEKEIDDINGATNDFNALDITPSPSTPNDTQAKKRHSDRVTKRKLEETGSSAVSNVTSTKKAKSKPALVRREIFDLTSQDIDEVLILKYVSKDVLKTVAAGISKSTNAYSFAEHAEEYLECPENKKAAFKKHCAKFFRDEKKEKKD